MIAPFDKLYNPDGDFFTESGREILKEFDSEQVLLEHWGPDCKLMSRARGKPIQMISGMWIEGPKAVRSEQFPLGLPWLPAHLQARVRQSNAMFRFSLRRLHLRLRSFGVAVIEHPVRSFGWNFPEALELFNSNGTFFTVFWNCCFGGERQKCTAFLHNCPQLHQALHKPTCGGHDYLKPFEVHELEDGRLSFDTEKEAEYPFKLCEVYARATTAYFKDIKGDIIPAAPSCRAGWVLNKLLLSTKHLTKSDILDVVLPELTNLINSLSKGNEKEHLHSLLRLADFRGSDVRLLTETLVDGSRQHIPYPASIWRWECVQSYPWGEKQHINILECYCIFDIFSHMLF